MFGPDSSAPRAWTTWSASSPPGASAFGGAGSPGKCPEVVQKCPAHRRRLSLRLSNRVRKLLRLKLLTHFFVHNSSYIHIADLVAGSLVASMTLPRTRTRGPPWSPGRRQPATASRRGLGPPDRRRQAAAPREAEGGFPGGRRGVRRSSSSGFILDFWGFGGFGYGNSWYKLS